jgi:hypothetical protein
MISRIDQPGAKLREVEHAGHQRDEPGEVEDDDAAGKAGEALADEELPGGARHAAKRTGTLFNGTRRVLAGLFSLGGGLHADWRGSIEHVVQSSRDGS